MASNSGKNVSEILGYSIGYIDIFKFGPSKFEFIGKKLENLFWKECFISVKVVIRGALLSDPNKIIIAPIWENPAVTRNNKQLKDINYPDLVGKVNQIADFFKPNTNLLYSKQEFELRHTATLTDDSFTELRYIIVSSIRKVGLNYENIPPVLLPLQPLIVSLVTRFKKGCSIFYRHSRKAKSLTNLTADREDKWHKELNKTYGIEFWNSTYKLVAGIANDNALKWMQYQIVRNSLYTNYRVSKFNNSVSPMCTFCQSSEEKISHLYFHCHRVQLFLDKVRRCLHTFDFRVPTDITQLIFGITSESPNSQNNYLVLLIKQYIWKSRFGHNGYLSLGIFKEFLKGKLSEIKEVYNFYNENISFNKWLILFSDLVQDH